MAFDVGSVVAHIKADLSGFSSGINQAKDEVSSMGSKVGDTIESIKGGFEQMGLVVAAEAATFGFFAHQAIDIASNYEQTRISLNAFTGSVESGAKAMSLLNDFAKQAPLVPIADVLAGGKQLIGFGLVKSDLSDLQTQMKQTSELAIATKTPISVAIDLFARAKEGIFNLREMGQFGITREELEKFGVEFTKAGSAINKSELLPALQKLIDSRYGTLFAQEQGTFAGAVQNAKDDLSRLAGAFLGVDAATGTVRNGSLFQKLEQAANGIYNFLEANMKTITMLSQDKNLQTLIEGFVVALGSLVIIIPIVIAALNPWILIVLAIEAVIVALYYAWNTNFMGIRNITQSVSNEVINFFNNYLKPAIDTLTKFWNAHWYEIKDVLLGTWEIMKGIVITAWAIIYGTLKIAIDIFTGNWSRAWTDVVEMFKVSWGQVAVIMNGALDFLRGIGHMIFDALTQPFRDAWNEISSLVSKIKDAMDFTKRHSPSVIDIIENGVNLANQALSKLAFNNTFAVNPAQVFSSAVNSAPMYNQIAIDMNGAIISDESSASAMGEKIGDAIIDRLRLNVRF